MKNKPRKAPYKPTLQKCKVIEITDPTEKAMAARENIVAALENGEAVRCPLAIAGIIGRILTTVLLRTAIGMERRTSNWRRIICTTCRGCI